MSSLHFQFDMNGQHETLHISGGVDVRTFVLFDAVMQCLANSGGVLHMDLGDVDSFNSPAVGALVMLATQRRSHGGMLHVRCRSNGTVALMIQRARLDALFNLEFDPGDSSNAKPK